MRQLQEPGGPPRGPKGLDVYADVSLRCSPDDLFGFGLIHTPEDVDLGGEGSRINGSWVSGFVDVHLGGLIDTGRYLGSTPAIGKGVSTEDVDRLLFPDVFPGFCRPIIAG